MVLLGSHPVRLFGCPVAVAAALAAGLFLSRGSDAAPPSLHADGDRLVDATGEPVILRGVNAGNWLLCESWMAFKGGLADHHEIEQTLISRFGREEGAGLLSLWRESFMTARDFALIRDMGLNVVRVPFFYRDLLPDADKAELGPDPFRWTDRAVNLAEEAGLYVILDMHGAPGGQSNDQPCGWVGQDRLFKSETAQAATAFLWGEIAARYRDRPSVIAYDLINEPFGSPGDEALLALYDRLYAAVRARDPRILLFMEGSYGGVSGFGPPAARGWRNVGYSEHHYPGVFGGAPASLELMGDYLRRLEDTATRLREWGVPFLVGEFNPNFADIGHPYMLKAMYDRYAQLGWHATLWSYKLVYDRDTDRLGDGWPLAVYAKGMALNPKTDSAARLRAGFGELSSGALTVNTAFARALAGETDFAMPLPASRFAFPEPAGPAAAGWDVRDLGDARPGRFVRTEDGSVFIAGGGWDFWNASDRCRIVTRPARPEDSLEGVLTLLEPAGQWSKVGMTLRADEEPDSPHLSIVAFSWGEASLTWRPARGADTQSRSLGHPGFPMRLAVRRRAGTIEVGVAGAEAGLPVWHVGPAVAELAEEGRIGYIASANSGSSMAVGVFRRTAPPPGPNLAGPDPLAAGTVQGAAVFERVEDAPDGGGPALAYRHGEDRDRWGSGFRTAPFAGTVPGRRYVLTVDVSCSPAAGAALPQEIELKLWQPLPYPEGTRDARVAMAKLPGDRIPTDGSRRTLRLPFGAVAASASFESWIRAADGERGGTLYLRNLRVAEERP